MRHSFDKADPLTLQRHLGFSDQARNKPACIVTEEGYTCKISKGFRTVKENTPYYPRSENKCADQLCRKVEISVSF